VHDATGRSAQAFWLVAASAVVLTLLPQLLLRSLDQAGEDGALALSALAAPAPGWAASPPSFVDWRPAFQNPSATLRQQFDRGSLAVGLHVDYYRKQGYQRKLVSSDNVLVTSNDKHWARVSQGSQRITLQDHGALTLNSAELRGSGSAGQLAQHRLLAWQLYWVNGRWTDSAFLAKAYGAWYKLLGRGDDGASVVFYAEKDAVGGAEAVLTSFVRENLHLIEAQLRKTRGNEHAI
jgi:EpsI family protein